MKYNKEELINKLNDLQMLKPRCEGVNCRECDLALEDEAGFLFCVFIVAEHLAGKLQPKKEEAEETEVC